jgi:hypothetical protein
LEEEPGTVLIRKIPHTEFQVDEQRFRVIKSVWNGITGRSFESGARQPTAHLHDYGWVGGSCCWDERLR